MVTFLIAGHVNYVDWVQNVVVILVSVYNHKHRVDNRLHYSTLQCHGTYNMLHTTNINRPKCMVPFLIVFSALLKELCHDISVLLVTEAGWGSPIYLIFN